MKYLDISLYAKAFSSTGIFPIDKGFEARFTLNKSVVSQWVPLLSFPMFSTRDCPGYKVNLLLIKADARHLIAYELFFPAI
ncbi:MAG TPA: hypothetical protein PK771_14750 [Spirochaetota bacterium]|nr:hypothetical protein [Spirochaetota bacterium]